MKLQFESYIPECGEPYKCDDAKCNKRAAYRVIYENNVTRLLCSEHVGKELK